MRLKRITGLSTTSYLCALLFLLPVNHANAGFQVFYYLANGGPSQVYADARRGKDSQDPFDLPFGVQDTAAQPINDPSIFNASVNVLDEKTIACLVGFNLVTLNASAEATATHSSEVEATGVTFSGIASTALNPDPALPPQPPNADYNCLGLASASVRGRYAIHTDQYYEVTFSGQLGGSSSLWIRNALGTPFNYFKDTPGPVSATVILAPGSYYIDAGAQVPIAPLSSQFEGTSTFGLSVQFATVELCNNGADDDGDGLVDGLDPDCAVPEVCDNNVDDDFDGLVDAADPDCAPPPATVGLLVRCYHEPLYPQAGEVVQIFAQAIDANGDAINADTLEFLLNNPENVVATDINASSFGASYFFSPGSGRFSYGCRAKLDTETAISWLPVGLLRDQLRLVDVGTPELPTDKYQAIPVWMSGDSEHKIDVVFLHDKDQYSSYLDPDFIADAGDIVAEGMFTIPWFVENQAHFNIWLGMADTARAGPKDSIPDGQSQPNCYKKRPDKFKKFYAFAEATGIIHKSGALACRDHAGMKVFTTEVDPRRLQVVSHEIGHAAFGMSDEYCNDFRKNGNLKCRGFRFTSPVAAPGVPLLPPFPNLYGTEARCRSEALQDGYDPDACRNLPTALILDDFWLREPDFSNDGAGGQIPWNLQVPDLMQQSGRKMDSAGVINDFYGVGDSERERMNWVIDKCIAGEC